VELTKKCDRYRGTIGKIRFFWQWALESPCSAFAGFEPRSTSTASSDKPQKYFAQRVNEWCSLRVTLRGATHDLFGACNELESSQLPGRRYWLLE